MHPNAPQNRHPRPANNGHSAEQPLIVSQVPVTRSQFLQRPVLQAGLTAVYATADGRVEHLGRLLSMSEAISGRYKVMYQVYVAARTSYINTDDELRTRDDRFSFTTSAKVGWRVTDPAAVVREQVRYAESAVGDYVFDLMRRIGRKYEIRECELAENEINLLAAQPIPMPGLGITVTSVAARLSLDEATQQFLRRQVQLSRDLDLLQQEHLLDVDKQRNENQLTGERLQAVAAGVQGEFGLITMHLMQNPGESMNVLNMLHERQRELEQQQRATFADTQQMFERMLDSDHFNSADLEDFREMLIRSMVAGAPNSAGGPLPIASIPIPPALRASQSGGTGPQAPPGQAAPGPQMAPGQAPSAQPAAASGTTDQAIPTANGSNGVSGWRQRKPSSGGS